MEDKSFHLLMKLEVLDLSHNKIRKLKSNSFLGLNNIKVLNLKHNLIMFVPIDTFRKILPNTVHSFNTKVCCMSGPWINCKVIGDVFSNCDDLLSNNLMRYFCWIIGILACLLNIITFVLHSKNIKETQKNTSPLNYLALIDCMFGVYLIIIASADRVYQKRYVGYELSWRTNYMCKISSVLALIYMMVSPVILCIMMLVRYCIIQWPMTSKFKNKQFVKRIVEISLIGATFLCVILISGIFGIHKNHVPIGICLLLYKVKDQSLFLLLTSSIIIFVQITSLLVILVLTILSITKVIQTESEIGLKSRNRKSVKVAKQLLLAVFTNMCCWIPSSVIFILLLVGNQVSNDLLG